MSEDVIAGGNVEEPRQDAAASQEALGPFQRTDEELVKQVRLWFKESADATGDVRRKRRDEWKQLAGDQWNEADAKIVDGQKRPKLTLNMLLTIMAAVEGEERTNRQEIKLYGEGQGDDTAAYGLNQLLKWVMNQCGGEFALSQMFRAGSAVGEGWVCPDVDFFEDPEGKINLKHVDEDECFDDPLGKCPAGSDSRYFVRVRMMTEDELDARWPGAKAKVRAGALFDEYLGKETDGSGYRDIYLTPNDASSPKLYDAQKKLWSVIECWWHQIEPGHVVVNEQTGILEEKTAEEFAAMRTQRENEQNLYRNGVLTGAIDPLAVPGPAPLQAAERPIKVIYQCFVCYDQLLGKARAPIRELKRFPYVPFRAILDKIKGEWFGLLRPLIDPQRQHNVEQSAIVHMVQLMPKQAWMAPKGAFHNKHEWQEKIAQPGAMLEYNNRQGKPEPVPVPVVPRHLIDMAFSRPQAMREISGVNVEMTGQRQGADAGVVMEMRSKAARTVLAPIFDNYRMAKKELGKVLLAYVQTYVKTGRRIRVLGPEGAQYVQMTEQMGLGRYDLAVEETNSTVNDRIATLNILQTTLPTLMKSGMQPPPEFIDLLPMPPHIRDQWKRQIAWQMTISGQLPPPGWQPGMPPPAPGMPPEPASAGDPAQPHVQ